jgi:hypothetical protein
MVVSGSCARDHVECVPDLYGVPCEFAEQHFPSAIAQLEAERRAFRERSAGKG